MAVLIIALGLLAVVGLTVLIMYNSLVSARLRMLESFSGIDVQLKRRSDLIPNLVETIKGYAKHEKGVFEEVTKARAALLSAHDPHAQAVANDSLSGALKTLFAVAESYPDLKASNNFKELQDELADTETKIASARQFYNANVLDYHTRLAVFPSNLIAGIFAFQKAEFFEAREGDREEVQVKFT